MPNTKTGEIFKELEEGGTGERPVKANVEGQGSNGVVIPQKKKITSEQVWKQKTAKFTVSRKYNVENYLEFWKMRSLKRENALLHNYHRPSKKPLQE